MSVFLSADKPVPIWAFALIVVGLGILAILFIRVRRSGLIDGLRDRAVDLYNIVRNVTVARGKKTWTSNHYPETRQVRLWVDAQGGEPLRGFRCQVNSPDQKSYVTSDSQNLSNPAYKANGTFLFPKDFLNAPETLDELPLGRYRVIWSYFALTDNLTLNAVPFIEDSFRIKTGGQVE
jgi:hypothetical protein